MGAERDLAVRIPAALLPHSQIHQVRLIGSRAAGSPVPLSDWDFDVETHDFPVVAADLPDLVSGLEPLAQQWDRLSTHQCYMLMLTGPAKIDLLFLDRPHQPKPPWQASAETLPGIDRHFWDWALWLAAKQQAGKDELVRGELNTMARHLLVPLGVPDVPESLEAAVASYRAARDRLESQFNVAVSRRLEREVSPVLPRR
jgi:hypothetical protein